MQIRLATARDIPAILEIVRSVVPGMRAIGNLQWDDLYPNTEVFENDIARDQLWIAERDSVLAGVAAFTTGQDPDYAQAGWDPAEPAIVIHRLAVHPAMRGQGIAAALMQQAETLAPGLGITVLHVDTSADNVATQRLFPKLGYLFTGEIVLPWRPGMRVLCYEKRLVTR